MIEDSVSGQSGLTEWLDFLEPILAGVSNYRWTGDDAEQFWQFLQRGAITRQQEALQATSKMADEGYGHFAVTFLRPAYEELIWIEYLNQNISLAPELPGLLGQYEVGVSLDIQNERLGKADMAKVGFTQRYVKKTAATTRRVEAQIKEIGRSLSWPKKKQNVLPSMWFLSKKVGREEDYKYLYHATSRFVHFSAHEIYRRVWGGKGEVTIGSRRFSSFWEDFATYWGVYILLELLAQCVDLIDEIEIDENEQERMIKLVEEFRAVPIITASELESWGP